MSGSEPKMAAAGRWPGLSAVPGVFVVVQEPPLTITTQPASVPGTAPEGYP